MRIIQRMTSYQFTLILIIQLSFVNLFMFIFQILQQCFQSNFVSGAKGIIPTYFLSSMYMTANAQCTFSMLNGTNMCFSLKISFPGHFTPHLEILPYLYFPWELRKTSFVMAAGVSGNRYKDQYDTYHLQLCFKTTN